MSKQILLGNNKLSHFIKSKMSLLVQYTCILWTAMKEKNAANESVTKCFLTT